ncbi:hypothetical protein NIES2135_09760 [Leptolyngbya boryana NIES-2135]|jgi:hypothetical protein|uniref:FHA domain-containing protein n=1 Tax=Leptolyngbya boryana NIES-2135 TaxID=1973484 RepID=A0A1Z4JBM9_LEPBY|nr:MULTISPECIES: hypothetical protein [Leptolyngbya]BAY54162.1 hypothetical protein NIES2135_09760 [Leptolyngbya boryana NIES-2135]MBD2371005.1 hypothetical protein [Leptolyngbya sp. FACHB-161]MBD2377537.1 hypothetical protein [Leptolyngbya sp. FACHB-238]MBD2401945.1 hypothetical protein [Leptolyngbya sp. FACHB-239]MBD2408463.1 hypothetical protein [Leptolyngbya sp. FACHB-402]
MRTILYFLAGMISALIGWNLGQLILYDLNWLQPFPMLVLFPCVAASLAVGLVINEIFLSNPTRLTVNFKIARKPLLIAAGLGLGSGFTIGAILTLIVWFSPAIPTWLLRVSSWLVIGAVVGFAEGLTWRWRSQEAGDSRRFQQRLMSSIALGTLASLVAAVIFELLWQFSRSEMMKFRRIEDPIGFTLLGALLGLALSIATSPSYMAALRAGTGFEFTGPNYDPDPQPYASYPRINHDLLKFVSEEPEEKQIEEGLSIQLPPRGKFLIGSGSGANIQIPHLPPHVANLNVEPRSVKLIPNNTCYDTISIDGERLDSRRTITLRHNTILAFYSQDDKKCFRFVYYNRFLDPLA